MSSVLNILVFYADKGIKKDAMTKMIIEHQSYARWENHV